MINVAAEFRLKANHSERREKQVSHSDRIKLRYTNTVATKITV